MARSAPRTRKKTRRSVAGFALRASVWVVAVAIPAGALCASGRTIWARVLARSEFQVRPAALNLNGHPEWVNGPAMCRELRRELSALPARTCLFQSDLAHAVQRELRGSPWVLDVRHVERRLPNMLSVRAVFRRPAGIVALGQRYYLVDADGHWLSETLFICPKEWGHGRPRLIVDRTLSQAPPRGRPWDAPRLSVGARLSDFFRRSGLFEKLDVTTIDVTNVARPGTEPDIILATAAGAQVKWGKSSVYEKVESLAGPLSEPSDADKLEMLLSKLDQYPELRGIQYVDLRYHGKIFFARAD